MAKPTRQRQLKTKVPILEAADLAQLTPPEAGRNLEDLPPEELQVVEDKINDLQNFVFSNFKAQNIEEELFQQPVTVGPPPSEPPKNLAEDLSDKPIREPPPSTPAKPAKPKENIYKKRLAELKAVQPYLLGRQSAQQLENTLEIYRGHFAQHMLSDSAWGLVFAALGPVGALLRETQHKKIAWQYAWSKNLLNPQAIFFYLNTLPEQKVFKFITHPVKKTIGLLAKSQNPLFSAHHYQDFLWNKNERIWETHTETIYGFTPFLAFSKPAGKLADYIDDRLLGVKWLTDKQGRRLKRIDDSRQINQRLTNALKAYEKAKKDGRPSLKNAQRNIFQALMTLDDGGGFFTGFLKNTLRHPLKRASKNLREAKLLLLLGFILWDITLGLIINAARYLAVQVISRIPALARIRAKVNQFFTSRRWLNTLNMGRQTLAAQARALISLSTFSGGFLSAQLMAPLGTQAMYAGGFLGGVLGWQYQALLNMANNPTLMEFAHYPHARAIRALGRLGAPGPMLRTAYWLKQNPWFRVPLKGAFLGQLIAPFLEEFAGINPATTIWGSTAINYFWASRKFWLQKILAKPFGKLAVKFGLPPKLVKSFFQSPGKIFFKTLYESGLAWPFKKFLWSWNLNWPIQTINKFLARPLVQKFFKNMLANPGFFLGFELISILHAAGLPWLAAIPLGPLIGGFVWNVGAFILETITGVSKATLAPLGWLGFTIGWAGEIASTVFGFALPSWWSVSGLTMALPLSWALVYGLGQLLSLGGFAGFGLLGFGLTAAMESMLAGGLLGVAGVLLPPLAVIGAVIVIAGLIIFFTAATVASTWVPFSGAPTSSSCLQLQLEANKTALALNESAEVCANLTIIPNPLLLSKAKIQCAAQIHPSIFELKNNKDQSAVTASRQFPGQSPFSLIPARDATEVLDKNNRYRIFEFPVIEGMPGYGGFVFNDLLNIELSVLGFDDASGNHISGQPLRALMSQFPAFASQVRNSVTYIDDIQNHPSPATAKSYLLSESETQLAFTKDQQSESQELIKDLKSLQNRVNSGESPAEIVDDLENLLKQVNLLIALPSEPDFYYQSQYAEAQAFKDACSEIHTYNYEIDSCEQHYQKLISIYQSWTNTFQQVPYGIEELIFFISQSDTNKLLSKFSEIIIAVEEFNQTLPNIISGLEFAIKEIEDIDLDNLYAFLDKKFYYLPGGTVYKMCFTVTLIHDNYFPDPSIPFQSLAFECTAASTGATDLSPRPDCLIINNVSFNKP